MPALNLSLHAQQAPFLIKYSALCSKLDFNNKLLSIRQDEVTRTIISIRNWYNYSYSVFQYVKLLLLFYFCNYNVIFLTILKFFNNY